MVLGDVTELLNIANVVMHRHSSVDGGRESFGGGFLTLWECQLMNHQLVVEDCMGGTLAQKPLDQSVN
jgi:hypothetical protein